MQCIRATIKDIARMTGVNRVTIRRMADQGLLESVRDYNGWRIFPNPVETAEKVKLLMGISNDNVERLSN